MLKRRMLDKYNSENKNDFIKMVETKIGLAMAKGIFPVIDQSKRCEGLSFNIQ